MHHNLSDHLVDLLENIYTKNAIDVDRLAVANQLLQSMRLEPNANAFLRPKIFGLSRMSCSSPTAIQ